MGVLIEMQKKTNHKIEKHEIPYFMVLLAIPPEIFQ